MKQFDDWVKRVTPSSSHPIFTAFNAPFDWMFINTYFHKYLGYNPFGYKALDIKSLYMGIHKTKFGQTSHFMVNKALSLAPELTHHALEDAIHERAILKTLIKEIQNNGGTDE